MKQPFHTTNTLQQCPKQQKILTVNHLIIHQLLDVGNELQCHECTNLFHVKCVELELKLKNGIYKTALEVKRPNGWVCMSCI